MEKNVMNDKKYCGVAKRAIRSIGAVLVALFLFGTQVAPSYAQSYPDKPIRLVIIFAPGGGVDSVGRIIATKLSEALGQPVVPENRAGAGGNVAFEFVAKARPDGYTLVFGAETLTMSPGLYNRLNYDPIKDLQPIAQTTESAILLFVRPDFPAKDLKEFVEYAKANPGKVTYGTGGVGSAPHLAGEMLKSLAKIDIVHVPYKGVAPALVGMMGGEVDMAILTPAAAAPQVQAGKARALAVLGNTRTRMLPDVPTTKEAGIDNFVVTGWYGILAPAGTPQDIVNRLSVEINKITAMPDTQDKIQKVGVEPVTGSTPEKFAEFINAEIPRWNKITKDANIPKID
ncbi:MFS transporter [Betaproteobacteria bacterium]|nr:MFS transporter [Betaproteobacteria bacterium]